MAPPAAITAGTRNEPPISPSSPRLPTNSLSRASRGGGTTDCRRVLVPGQRSLGTGERRQGPLDRGEPSAPPSALPFELDHPVDARPLGDRAHRGVGGRGA